MQEVKGYRIQAGQAGKDEYKKGGYIVKVWRGRKMRCLEMLVYNKTKKGNKWWQQIFDGKTLRGAGFLTEIKIMVWQYYFYCLSCEKTNI